MQKTLKPATGSTKASETGSLSIKKSIADVGKIVLVFQGGGALGAYQAGVYQALHESGIEPDWVIGTSIGAINAGLIAGNKPENRLQRLQEFWKRMEHHPMLTAASMIPGMGDALTRMSTVMNGIPGFFKPNMMAFLGNNIQLGSESASYYSTAPLEETLKDLIDFSVMNAGSPRLTVGAANVRTSEMRYFDSRDMQLDHRHIMASGALPPAFPAVRIDDELYWDGGILSNTPVEAVFDDRRRSDSLVFAVHIWNPDGAEPTTIGQVLNRQKDIQYSSRAVSHVNRQKQLHRLRHIVRELSYLLPEDIRNDPKVREMSGYGCLTRMHVVRLLAPNLEKEDHTKDIDFSASGIRERWHAGYADTLSVLESQPWIGQFDPLEGVILHEAKPGVVVTTG